MIKIYIADVSYLCDRYEYDRCFSLMSEYRKAKISRMRFDSDRRLSLGAGVLLRNALEDFGLYGDDLITEENRQGKPYFPALAGKFEYSLSHSGTMAMCAAAYSESGKAPMLGCDTEKIPERFNSRIAERYFSPYETAMINSLTDEGEKRDMFTRLWTLKESYIKCTGLGFSCPLNSFCINFGADGNIGISPPELNEKYAFGEERRNDGYKYSWCFTK